jgi:hypothetical protein
MDEGKTNDFPKDIWSKSVVIHIKYSTKKSLTSQREQPENNVC